MRLPDRVKAPGGTIHRVVYNTRKLETEYWVGTDDTGATDSNPAGSFRNKPGSTWPGKKMTQCGDNDRGSRGGRG